MSLSNNFRKKVMWEEGEENIVDYRSVSYAFQLANLEQLLRDTLAQQCERCIDYLVKIDDNKIGKYLNQMDEKDKYGDLIYDCQKLMVIFKSEVITKFKITPFYLSDQDGSFMQEYTHIIGYSQLSLKADEQFWKWSKPIENKTMLQFIKYKRNQQLKIGFEDQKSNEWWGINACISHNSWNVQIGHWQSEQKIKIITIKYARLPPTGQVEVIYQKVPQKNKI